MNYLTTFPMVNKLVIKSLTISVFIFTSVFVWAKEIPPKPKRLVNDYANLLSKSEVNLLEQKLVDFDNNTTNQIAVVIIQSLEGDDEFEFAQKLATKWGIGGKNDNGVLLLISKDDRKIRIQTGYGAEGVLPDITAKQIIEDEIKPYFKQGQFFNGIDAGVSTMMLALKGEYNTKRNDHQSEDGNGWFVVPFLIFLILIWRFRSKRTYTYSGKRKGVSSPDPFITSIFLGSMFRDGGSSGGFGGGGGFGGFGGGGFGGGGASGSW